MQCVSQSNSFFRKKNTERNPSYAHSAEIITIRHLVEFYGFSRFGHHGIRINISRYIKLIMNSRVIIGWAHKVSSNRITSFHFNFLRFSETLIHSTFAQIESSLCFTVYILHSLFFAEPLFGSCISRLNFTQRVSLEAN